MAPQKAPMPPSSAAMVATAELRCLVSVAIAGYETARAPVRGVSASVRGGAEASAWPRWAAP